MVFNLTRTRFLTRTRIRFCRSGASQALAVFLVCWVYVAWKNALKNGEPDILENPTAAIGNMDDRPEIRALKRDTPVERLPGFVSTPVTQNGSKVRTAAGLVLEFFANTSEDKKPNLYNMRYLLRDVLGYEVVKCPMKAGTVKSCKIPPAFVQNGTCWKFLWLYGGMTPKATKKILSSLETCPGAAIPFYPDIDAGLVSRRTFTRFREFPGVAKSFEYPKERSEAANAFKDDLYVILKTPAHRGKGVEVIPRKDNMLDMMAYFIAQEKESNVTANTTTQSAERKLAEKLPPWEVVWAEKIFNPANPKEADMAKQVEEDSPFIIQQFINNPMLLHGRFFDMGVFVLLVSVNPIRLYIYNDDVLVKVCSKNYPKPFDPRDTDGYLISDANNVFLSDILDDPELKGNSQNSTTAGPIIPTEKQILKEYFKDNFKTFGNGSKIFKNSWKTIERVLKDAFSEQEQKIAWDLGHSWGKRAAVDEDSSAEKGTILDLGELPPETLAFQLFRADFVFNTHGEPILTEINGMPQFMKGRRLSVLHEMFQLVGLDTHACGGDAFEKQLQRLCPQDCSNNLGWCSRAKCRNVCYKCLPKYLQIQARRYHCENLVANRYKRLLPARERGTFVNYQKSRLTTINNEWMFDWQEHHYPVIVPPAVKKRNKVTTLKKKKKN